MQTALSDHHRHQYLKALGIPVWLERSHDDAEPTPIEVVKARVTPTQATQHNLDAAAALLEDTPKTTEQLPKEHTPAKQNITAIDCTHSNWSQLQSMVANCQHCPLHDSRHQAILSSGSYEASCMIIGDTPTELDDRQNQLFAAQPGQLLNNMLKAIGLDRHSVHITTMTKCRTPADRTAQANEQAQCRAYLERQIELIKPQAIFVMGRTASQSLLQQTASIAQLRGKIHQLQLKNSTLTIPTIVSLHPRNLLRQPKNKAKAWQDLKQLATLLRTDD